MRPAILQTGAVDYVGSGMEFSFQGVVISESPIANYKWTQVAGPTPLNFTRQWVQSGYGGFKIKDFVHGTYELRLDVTDEKGAKGSDFVKLTFPRYGSLSKGPHVYFQNSTPEYWVGSDFSRAIVEGNAGIGFSVARHVGTMRDYDIRQVAGPSLVAFEYKDPRYLPFIGTKVYNVTYGVYTFEATVTDDQGLTASETFKVILTRPLDAKDHSPLNPVVNPVLLPERNGEIVYAVTGDIRKTTLVANASLTADSRPRDFNVRQIAGPTVLNCPYKVYEANFVTCFYDNLDYGTYRFEFTALDESGKVHRTSGAVTYPRPLIPTSTNQAPQITLASKTEMVVPPLAAKIYVEAGQEFSHQGVVFDDGSIASYQWTQLSGPTQLKIVRTWGMKSPYYGLSFTNCAYGSYEFQLEVVDDLGAKSTKNVVFTFPRPASL